MNPSVDWIATAGQNLSCDGAGLEPLDISGKLTDAIEVEMIAGKEWMLPPARGLLLVSCA